MEERRSILSGLLACILFALCGVLGALQYTWNAEVSAALRDRLQASLTASLGRLSRDFNAEIYAACNPLTPLAPQDSKAAEAQIVARFEQWSKSARRRPALRRVGLAVPNGEGYALRLLDLQKGSFVAAPWPLEWKDHENRLARMARPPTAGGFGRDNPDFDSRGPRAGDDGTLFEHPLFASAAGGGPLNPFDFGRREILWMIFDLNPDYLLNTLLPEELQRHLSSGGNLDYQVEVVSRSNPATVIYHSDPNEKDFANSADASVSLLDVPLARFGGPNGGPDRGRGFGPGRPPAPDMGRWEMYVRHRAGSLAAVVAQTRHRNMAVTACVMLFMLATVTAWVRLTRRTQRLAEIQMRFVAGISHELRTPLTVIHTAAFNLQGKLAKDPAKVEGYGKLIQQESGRLKDMVEQVLQFASAKAGRLIQQLEPVEIEGIIDQTIESSRAATDAAHCCVEKKVEPGLPSVEGDARALRLALENLVGNAAKYGSGSRGWIGISASAIREKGQQMLEIRVADCGPGIPQDEQRHLFEPFFRGRQAIEGHVHGTGLGLNLVKRVAEAHGGTVRVHSVPNEVTEFVMRIPAMATLHKTPETVA